MKNFSTKTFLHVLIISVFSFFIANCSKETKTISIQNDNKEDIKDTVNYKVFFGTAHGHSSYFDDAQIDANAPGLNFDEAKK